MQVIQAHRRRVAEFADILKRLLAMERELYDLRSRSWGMQMGGSATRESELHDVHETIEAKLLEVENLRQVLAGPAHGSAE